MAHTKNLLLRFLCLLSLLILHWACTPIASQNSFRTDESGLSRTHEGLTQNSEQPVKEEEEDTIPEPELTVSQEVKELASLGTWEEGSPEEVPAEKTVTYDFPVTMNKQVDFYLDFFQNRQRDTFRRWLERSGRYLPMIQEHLREAGMPLDLAYLPMIESGYSLTAYSRARAVGPWQFIRATGRNYGLTINNYIDDRRNPIKSTKAAIAYLSALYEEFGSWELAVAGYNAGEGKIKRAIKRYKTNNFWKLAKGRYLKLETKRYVPKLIAAIIIAKDPERYGFTDLDYEEPLAFETVNVPRWTSLRAVAVACDVEYEKLRNLNRELRRAITPPGSVTYPLKVPVGKKTLVAKNLPNVRAIVTTRYKSHVVKHGETVTRICRKYNLNKTTLLKANNLRSARLSPGQHLRIPHQTTKYKLVARNDADKPAGPAEVSPANLVLHKVQPGETISVIASRYCVPIHLLAAWNDIKDVHRIKTGQQLALYLQDSTGLMQAATAGEPRKSRSATSGHAAKVSKLPVTDTKSAKTIKTGAEALASSSSMKYYRVRGGDSLWTIARKFQTTPKNIRRWNGLKDDLIHPGLRLVVKLNDIDT